jgi:uncharacterized membrane protein
MEVRKQDSFQEISTGRLEAFSDGVFAIAITLLIIEIKVPSHKMLEEQTLMHYIGAQWPKYFAYVFSFINLGIYWANHHYLFRLFRRTDHYFNLLNVLFLMTIAFIPYPAGILGEYIMDTVHRPSAISFFTLSIWFPAMAWLLIWLYAKHNGRLTDPRLSAAFIRKLTRLFLFSNILFMASFLISLINPWAGMTVCTGITILYLFPPQKPEYSS